VTRPQIVWAMTGYLRLPFPPVYSSHLRAIAYASRYFTVEDVGAVAGVGASDRMYTHSAENSLVQEFLATEGATHIFLTEVDMILPKDTLPKLAALDKPIASGLYFLRGGNGQPCLYAKSLTPGNNPYPHWPVTLFPRETPFRISARGGGCPGLGCVLIAREVFERVPFPWFDLKESHYGSDIYFYTKVRDAGIEVWVDPTVRCDQIDYRIDTFNDYVKRCEADPAFAGSGFIISGAGDDGP